MLISPLISPEGIISLLKITRAAARAQRDYLRQHGIDVDDAGQHCATWIIEHHHRFDATKSAWSTWCTNMCRPRIIDLCRHASRKCRKLPPGTIPADTAELQADLDLDLDLLRGMHIPQMVRYLMRAGRQMPGRRGSRFHGAVPSVVSFLAAKLGMGGKSMADYIRSDRQIWEALGIRLASDCPKAWIIKRWCHLHPQNSQSAKIFSAVKTLKLSFGE